MAFNIGITATRDGLTGLQLLTIYTHIKKLIFGRAEVALHQGCCVGGDEQITIMAHVIGIPVFGYPPTDRKLFSKLAFEISNETARPMPYQERNLLIVQHSNVVIGAPNSKVEEVRSGTWSTIRRAKAYERHTIIVYPDGETDEYFEGNTYA